MNNSAFNLTNRTALITGSSRGLGYTIAKGLGRFGATLVLNGRDKARLDKAADSLRAQGLNVSGKPFDVTQKPQIEDAVEQIEKEIAPIDILVNNAGIQDRAPIEEMTAQQWQNVINTNLSSVFLVSQCVGKRMIQRKQGKIINICSLMSKLGRPTISNYTAAKGGVKMLTRALTVEWAKHNIQVNGIGPGYFKTDLTRPLYEDKDFDSWIRSRTPAGRWGDPEDLVGCAVFLASSASDYVNGQIIYVDGGLLASV